MSYTAIVTREDGEWLGDIPSLDGASTYASSLRQLKDNLREVAILADHLDDNAHVNLELDMHGTDPAVQHGSNLRTRRQHIAQEQSELQHLTSAAIQELLAAGYSVRDTAET